MFNGKMKAVTFSYDDGVTQDRRLIDLFNKFNLDKRMCVPAVLNSIIKDCRTPKNCHSYVQDVEIHITYVCIYIHM